MVCDELARRHDGKFRSKFSGELAEVRIDGRKVALLKPLTYMNESGRSVAAAVRFFKVEPAVAARRARRGRPRAGPASGAARRRARGPQRAAVGRRAARDARFRAPAHRRRPAGARRPAAGRRLRALAVRARDGRRRAGRRGRPTPSRRSSATASTRRSSASTSGRQPVRRAGLVRAGEPGGVGLVHANADRPGRRPGRCTRRAAPRAERRAPPIRPPLGEARRGARPRERRHERGAATDRNELSRHALPSLRFTPGGTIGFASRHGPTRTRPPRRSPGSSPRATGCARSSSAPPRRGSPSRCCRSCSPPRGSPARARSSACFADDGDARDAAEAAGWFVGDDERRAAHLARRPPGDRPPAARAPRRRAAPRARGATPRAGSSARRRSAGRRAASARRAAGGRSASPSATSPAWTVSSSGSRSPATTASSGSRSAASSPSAAASSTSSRPPAGSRCASSSSGTRSSRCGPSPRSRSARSIRSRPRSSTRPPSGGSTSRAEPGRGRRRDPRSRGAAPAGPTSSGESGRRARGLAGGAGRPRSGSRASSSSTSFRPASRIAFEAQRPAIAARGLAEAERDLGAFVRAGNRVVVDVRAPRRGAADEGDAPQGRGGAARAGRRAAPRRRRSASRSRRRGAGFVSRELGLVLLPDTQVFRKRPPRTDARLGRALQSFADLRTGDYVVHEDHGVGKLARLRDQDGRGRHPRLPVPRVPRRRPPLRPARADRQGLALRRRRRRGARALEARRQGVAARSRRARARAPASSPASCSRSTR